MTERVRYLSLGMVAHILASTSFRQVLREEDTGGGSEYGHSARHRKPMRCTFRTSMDIFVSGPGPCFAPSGLCDVGSPGDFQDHLWRIRFGFPVTHGLGKLLWSEAGRSGINELGAVLHVFAECVFLGIALGCRFGSDFGR